MKREKQRGKKEFQISNWNPDFQWISEINQEDPSGQDELLRWIGKYGFLLEDDMLKALGKKNMKLLNPAVARINYLSTKIERSSLLAASRGEEEVIIDIQTFLMNEGWWDRAQRIKLRDFGLDIGVSQTRLNEDENMTRAFIQSYKELVHPSVLNMVEKRDPEGINLALNHIHSGSLNKSRRARAQRTAVKDFFSNIDDGDTKLGKEDRQRKSLDSKEALMRFIFSHSDKVDPLTLQGVSYNKDKDISEALRQIHSNSLRISIEEKMKCKSSYLEAAKSNRTTAVPKVIPLSNKKSPVPLRWDSLFFTGFEGVSVGDIWKGIKQVARIKDIVIPKRLDKYNKKFGFIKPSSVEDANRLLQVSNQLVLGGRCVRIERARDRHPQLLKKSSVPLEGKETKNDEMKEGNEGKESGKENIQVVLEEGMEEWVDMLARSVRIDLEVDYAPDSLWELILSKGFGDLGVRKRGPYSFLISFPDSLSLEEMDWKALEIDIKKVSKAALEDLCLSKLLSQWGVLASSSFPNIFQNELSNPRVCLVTPSMKEIHGNLNVHISGRDFTVEVSEIRNVVFWKDEVPYKKNNADSIFSSKSSQARTVEESVKPLLHPEVMSVGVLSDKSDTKSFGSSVELLQDSCDDSINYIEPVSEELRYRQARTENWNRAVESSTSFFPGQEDVRKECLNESSGNSINTKKWNRRGECESHYNSDKDSLSHDVLNADTSSNNSLTHSNKSFPELCSKLQNLRIKSKGGRMRKGRKFGCFDKNRRQNRKREAVPDWMIGRYVRVWNSAKTRKARGKMIEVRKKRAKETEQGKKGEMGNISAEDIYHLGVTLGLKPTKEKGQMIDLIEGRL
ncbi:hypothetical protein DCAR_0729965 [Daucus carota subsp. sativus]|uniref:RRM domain-containing protein n=1 Tax=Daucus carota subsp. sativus TaxID=79200 RepID=A0A161ZR66_DAUCS|nr:hypothetical protein DCAR_0729965 [Daucus carota subsp. sativus]